MRNSGEDAVFWVVSGRVQGVGYRWFAVKAARALEIKGWVRNTMDGQVEVLGVGSSENLRLFEESLWDGPASSHVDNVEKTSKLLDVNEFKSFEII
jgi:acylphosphatase